MIYKEKNIINNIIKKINLNQPDRKYLPSQYYPTPTQDDYILGAFSRYFVVKAKDLAEATELAKEYPDFELGGVIEIREVVKFDNM